MQPIRPHEVEKRRAQSLPIEVIKVFNDLIAQNYNNGKAFIYQDDAVEKICEALGIDRYTVFQKGYLDVEEAYKEAGWSVKYDKPGYNETYRANFIFTKIKYG